MSIRRSLRLSHPQATAASHALALASWWKTSRYCSRCGTPICAQAAGWEQHCPHCGAIEYPRQDPSMIVAVTDSADRLLLAHNIAWKAQSVSVLAGFVEAGEAPENAVIREVKEEVGLDVDTVTYSSSQAWPFPRSLMLGFHAHATSTAMHYQEDEIEWAQFFTRDEFDHYVTHGMMTPPGNVTIAATLIEEWLGHPIPNIPTGTW